MCGTAGPRPPVIGTPITPYPTFRPPTPLPPAAPSGPVTKPTGSATSGQAGTNTGPVIPPAPTLTAMLIGESLTQKVGVDQLKHPLITAGDPTAGSGTRPVGNGGGFIRLPTIGEG